MACSIQRDPDGDRCSRSRCSLNVEFTVLLLGAQAYPQQTERFRSTLLHVRNAPAVILDLQGYLLPGLFQSDLNMGGIGMPRHVCQHFLEDPKQRG